MALSLQSNTWHVKNSLGNYLSSAILSTTLPEEANAILQRVRDALNTEEINANTFKEGFSDDLDSLVASTRSTLDQMLDEQEQLISDIRSVAQAKTDAEAAAAAAAQSATSIGDSADAAAQSASEAEDNANTVQRVVDSIDSRINTGIDAIDSAKDIAISDVNAAGTTQIANIQAREDAAADSEANAKASEEAAANTEQNVRNLMLTGMMVVEDKTSTEIILDAESECRYIYGELASLEITSFPASGIVDIMFDSGTTPTTLLFPETAIVPEWFDPTDLSASTTYEFSIVDNKVIIMEWPIIST